MNSELLRYTMRKNNDNVLSLSKAVGIARDTLYKKIRGESEFTQTEIAKIANRYNLDDSLVVDIFLNETKLN